MGGLEDLPERVRTVEEKLDGLANSVDLRFAQVDLRFDQVDQRFDDVNRRFDRVDQRFAEVFVEMDKRFAAVDDAIHEQHGYIDFVFGQLRDEMRTGFARVDRLERKLDGVIETQTRSNQLAERRLTRLERIERTRG